MGNLHDERRAKRGEVKTDSESLSQQHGGARNAVAPGRSTTVDKALYRLFGKYLKMAHGRQVHALQRGTDSANSTGNTVRLSQHFSTFLRFITPPPDREEQAR